MVIGEEDSSMEEPLNREPKSKDLIANFLTPLGDECYDRNHGPVPSISAQEYRLTVDGLVERELHLTVSDLENKFKRHMVVCALQCAGNRRHEMRTRTKEVQGIDWFDAAILNAEWTGVLLRDVLEEAGVVVKASMNQELHVQFACNAEKVQDDGWYGASIPLQRALSESSEVLLALNMNGQPLSPNHGYPVRIVVPGVIGARSVKWVDGITISETESPNFYQQHDYKVLPPDATDAESADKYWEKVSPMMENVINSVVAVPADGETVERNHDGTITIKGYAVPQGDYGPTEKVEVSCDGGNSWTEARLGPSHRWSWVLWQADVPVETGEGVRIFSKATDRGGNTQTQERSRWNLRGIGYNGYESTVGVTVK